MSKLGLFSVFDSKAGAFLQPMTCLTKGVAIRAFSAAVSNPKHDFALHREDYTLFQLGTFDEISGELVSIQPPALLITALEAVAANENNQSPV